MRLRGLLLVVLGLLSPGDGEGLALDTTTSVTLDGAPSFTWGIVMADVRIVLGWADLPAIIPAFAVETPLLAAGHLHGTGLLREAENPLGFSAGSSVSQESTGMAVDRPALGGEMGFSCTPVPGSLGFFYAPDLGQDLTFGSWCSEEPFPWLRTDQLIALTWSEPAAVSQDWFPCRPAAPGGALLHAACRLGVLFPGLAAGCTLGCSAAERAAPGAFVQLMSVLGHEPVEAALLAGTVGDGYRSWSGRGSDTQWRLAARTRLHVGADTGEASLIVDILRPGLASGSSLPEKEQLRASWERSYRLSMDMEGSARLEAGKTIRFDERSHREEEASAAAVLSLESRPMKVACRVSWSSEDDLRARAVLTLVPVEALRVGLEAGTDRLGAGIVLRDAHRGRELSVKAGWKSGALSLALSWIARSAPDP